MVIRRIRYEPLRISSEGVRDCVEELSPEAQGQIMMWLEQFTSVDNLGILSAYELLGKLMKFLHNAGLYLREEQL